MEVANSHVPMMCAGDHSYVREEPWGSISLPVVTGLWGVTFPGLCTMVLPSPHPVLPSGSPLAAALHGNDSAREQLLDQHYFPMLPSCALCGRPWHPCLAPIFPLSLLTTSAPCHQA